MVPQRAQEMGAECIQVFISSPRTWRQTTYTDEQAQAFRAAYREAHIGPSFIHVVYLVNYATSDSTIRDKSIDALIQAMRIADLFGIDGIVTHLGSHKGLGFTQGVERLCEALGEGLRASKEVQLLLENSAGSGGNIGNSVEEIAEIIDRMNRPDRLAVCLDTAHLLASGYEIRTRSGLDQLFGTFDKAIGLDRLMLLHLNDSKTDIGSRVDRHENIGDGYIGLDGFREIVNHPVLRNIPGVLEVPGLANKGPDKENLDRLKGLINS